MDAQIKEILQIFLSNAEMENPINQKKPSAAWNAKAIPTAQSNTVLNHNFDSLQVPNVTPAFQNHFKVLTPPLPETSTEKWYAVYTRSRFEKKLFTALEKAGLKTYLPLVKEKRKWSDRIKTVVVPLLPSYVFIKLAKKNLSQLYYFPGFVRFVCQEGKPCEINEREIDLLKRIEQHGYAIETNVAACRVGDMVRINKGPMRGWEGRVDRQQGGKIVFLLESINQTLSVELCASLIEKTKN